MATLGMPLLGTGQDTPTLTSLLTARREREKQSKLAGLLANAYRTQDQAQRQGYIADAIRTDPKAGLGLAKLLQPTAQEQFTLAPGSKRFGPDGRVIAEVPFAPSSAKIVSVPDGVGGTRQMLFDPRTQKFSNPSYGGEPQQGQWVQPGASYQTPSGIVRIDPSIDPADLGAVQADIVNNAQDNKYRLPDQIVGSPQGQMGYTPPKPAMTPYQQETLNLSKQRLEAAQAARDQATAARKAADEAKAAQKQQAAASRQAEAAASAGDLIAAIDSLSKHPGFNYLGTAQGDALIALPFVRNAAKDADAQLRNISGQVALATMNRLKALSAQGATGFGALSQQELALLQNSIATLQRENISNQQLRNSLNVIRDKMQKIRDWQGGQQPQRPAASGGPKPGTVEGGYRFKGGNPADPNAWERL